MKTFQQFFSEAQVLNNKNIKSNTLRGSGTRSGLMGMSTSLPSLGTPSGKKFVPGQGDSYGIGGTKLAT